MNNTQADYTLIGADLTGLWLQPGFVEGIVADHKRFATLASAYQHIFRGNLEYAVLLWNGLPVRLSYPEDLPLMVAPLIAMLDALQRQQVVNRTGYDFRTAHLHAQWQIETNPESVTIAGQWHQVSGDYQAALNQLGMVRMNRLAFLREWKLLLQQLCQAFADAEAVLTEPEARAQLQTLRDLETSIPTRGRFYQYES